jgi:hypothetical protein
MEMIMPVPRATRRAWWIGLAWQVLGHDQQKSGVSMQKCMAMVNAEAEIRDQSCVETNSFVLTKEDVSIGSEDIYARFIVSVDYIMALMTTDDTYKYEDTHHWAQWKSQAAG